MDEQNTPTQPQAQPASEVPVTQEPAQTPVSSGFTPVGQLFKDAWHLTTKKMLKLLLTTVYGILAWVILALLLGLIVMISGLGAGGPEGFMSAFANPTFLSTMGLAFIVYIILAVALNIALQAASILVVAEPNEEKSTFQILKESFSFVIPLLVVGLISGFIVTGSMLLLLIPAIFVSIVLAFSTYTVLFDKKQNLAALRMSVGIIQQHFGAVVGRFILLFLVYVGFYIIYGVFASISDEIAILMQLVQFIFGIIFSWFAIAYAYLVYKQARASYDESQKVNMVWIWSVSGLGWLIGIFASVAIIRAIGTYSGQIMDTMLKEGMNGSEMMYDAESDVQYDGNVQMDGSFEEMFGEEFQKELQMEIERQQLQQEAGSEI